MNRFIFLTMIIFNCTALSEVGKAIQWPDDGGYRPQLEECYDIKEVSYSGHTIKGCYDSNRIMIMLNGTNAPCRLYNRPMLAAARRGYLVICPERPNAGNGKNGKDAFEYLRGKGSNATTVLITGHSQGGAGAFASAYLLQKQFPFLTIDILGVFPYFWELYWRPMPYLFPQIQGRKLILRGMRDDTTSEGRIYTGYNLLSEPKRVIAVDAGHMQFNPYWSQSLRYFD